MTLRTFTLDEVRELYQQHTDATGLVFEPGCAEQAFGYSGGQPYLVNALAKWCVDKIHDRRYGETITLADVHEAKEKIIRERGTHLDSLLERMQEPRVRRIVEPVLLGEDRAFSRNDDDYRYVLDLGLLVEEPNGQLRPANQMYTETIGRYLTRDDQDDMKLSVPETPWAKDDGLDMQGLLLAFQDFWRENAGLHPAPFGYLESYPHIVLQAFLQRVINGGGEIIREMAYEQVCRNMDHLGVAEGWLVVFDPDLTDDWDANAWQGRDERGVRGGERAPWVAARAQALHVREG